MPSLRSFTRPESRISSLRGRCPSPRILNRPCQATRSAHAIGRRGFMFSTSLWKVHAHRWDFSENAIVTPPRDLPAHLRGRPVSPEVLRAEGISVERLRRGDLTVLTRGFHISETIVDESPVAASTSGERFGGIRNLRALLLAEALPDCCLSHVTAARIHGLELPWEVRDDERMHLTQPAGTNRRIRRPGIVGHRRAVQQSEVMMLADVWVTTPARTWFDLARACSVLSLVTLGDHMVRTPRARFEGRDAPHSAISELRAVIECAGRVKGKRKAEQALGRIRVGSDSFQETALRLAIVDGGLPEPELQVRADPDDPYSPRADAGYPEARVAIQYDGATHFSPPQWRRDQRRDNRFTAAGWILLRFNVDDARDGFRGAVQQIRRALRRCGVV